MVIKARHTFQLGRGYAVKMIGNKMTVWYGSKRILPEQLTKEQQILLVQIRGTLHMKREMYGRSH